MMIRIHQEALRELEKAVVWYRKKSLFAPQWLQDEVVATSQRIFSSPQTFPIIMPGRRSPKALSL